jgi:hypothetical protein
MKTNASRVYEKSEGKQNNMFCYSYYNNHIQNAIIDLAILRNNGLNCDEKINEIKKLQKAQFAENSKTFEILLNRSSIMETKRYISTKGIIGSFISLEFDYSYIPPFSVKLNLIAIIFNYFRYYVYTHENICKDNMCHRCLDMVEKGKLYIVKLYPGRHKASFLVKICDGINECSTSIGCPSAYFNYGLENIFKGMFVNL